MPTRTHANHRPRFADLGARLRRTRRALGYRRQGAFARAAGLRANTYNQFESGINRPSLPSACRLCDAFSLTLDWIYRGVPAGRFGGAAILRRWVMPPPAARLEAEV